jgi:ubiquinone/menaquinone biosynthesis C-methylase UbiE
MESDSALKIEKEKQFHNSWARSMSSENLFVNENFESPTAQENRHALMAFGDIKGKRILDLGCGAGECSVYFAYKEAIVHACDISDGFIEIAKELSIKHGINVDFRVADVASLPYPDNYFDFVFGNGVLHHIDLMPAAKEIKRVLKPSGRAAFIEPLPYNPVINIYRIMAKDVRSFYEKPLSFKRLMKFARCFSCYEHTEFWLFSLCIFLHFFFVRGWHPSKVRYWKRIIEVGDEYKNIFFKLQRLDSICLRYIPFTRYLYWNTVLVVTK